MIGNEHAAAAALAGTAPVLSYDGSTRDVYLIDGVVYKVESHPEYVGFNASEYETINNLAHRLPEGVHYPITNLFTIDGTDVIAMEYIEGQPVGECYCIAGKEECNERCMTEDVYNLVKGVLDDTGGFNVIINDRGLWIIDAA